jgi:hypothetical protein
MYLSVMSAVILWDVPAYNYNVTCIESKMKMYQEPTLISQTQFVLRS